MEGAIIIPKDESTAYWLAKSLSISLQSLEISVGYYVFEILRGEGSSCAVAGVGAIMESFFGGRVNA